MPRTFRFVPGRLGEFGAMREGAFRDKLSLAPTIPAFSTCGSL
jgi:hypothetical protein